MKQKVKKILSINLFAALFFLIIIFNITFTYIFTIHNFISNYIDLVKIVSVLKANDDFFFPSNTYQIFNVFDNKESKSNFRKAFNFFFWNKDITENVIRYMNTSTYFTTINIYFNVTRNVELEIICTYCSLYTFILNKQYHLINFVGLPLEIKNILGSNVSSNDFCINNKFILESEACFKYSSLSKISNSNEKEKARDFRYKFKNGKKKIECSKLINNDNLYIKYASKKRIKYKEKEINMSCSAINQRGFQNVNGSSIIEKKYSLAYARNVYQDYAIIELFLLAEYSKNNHYCFSVDIKYPNVFKKMKQLERCLPNVYVVDKQYNMTSFGRFTSISHFECMKLLLRKNWNYLFLLQMDDIVIKSNREILEILEAMDFPLDMAVTNERNLIKKRVDFTLPWSYKALNIFLKDDKRRNDPKIMNSKITFHKGLVPMGMKRESVDYLVNKLNITTFLNQLNTKRYGIDELTWQTLLTDDILNIPGGVSKKCTFIYHPRSTYLSRKVIWGTHPCPSKMYHHNICSWSVELLKHIKNYKEFYGYRFKKNHDFGALKCWANYMYQKNNLMKHEKIDLWYYYNLPQSNYEKKLKNKNYKSISLCRL